MPPRIMGILETPVYVDDLEQAHAFYNGVLGLERMVAGERLHAYDVAPRQVLIVCLRGACDEDALIDGQRVPGHHATGPAHFAFRIDESQLEAWRDYLVERGIEIESRVTWPLGGSSLYFRDPFGNVVELATGGVWPSDQLG
ncbi:VOC family protein [uncultured Cohaesibacter sp.]|uniref:VOC family protein n=1 Tax=uncultured Cohaesibacter sp. TaxID=1002546 RepID=UPI00292D620D|nr:VOC family protein [uncultured Cohaesibacter sp.]